MLHPAFIEATNALRDPTVLKTEGGRTSSSPCKGECAAADAADWIDTADVWTRIAHVVAKTPEQTSAAETLAGVVSLIQLSYYGQLITNVNDAAAWAKIASEARQVAVQGSTLVLAVAQNELYKLPDGWKDHVDSKVENLSDVINLLKSKAEDTASSLKQAATNAVAKKKASNIGVFAGIAALGAVAVLALGTRKRR